jgi:hypothetical protein
VVSIKTGSSFLGGGPAICHINRLTTFIITSMVASKITMVKIMMYVMGSLTIPGMGFVPAAGAAAVWAMIWPLDINENNMMDMRFMIA